MKNIFTLLLGGLLTSSAFASNITLNVPGNRNYQVAIDGRSVDAYSDYSGNNTVSLNNLRTGRHTIEVYRIKKNRGWGNNNRVVSSSSFDVTPQNDLNITVDNNGAVNIYESRSRDYGRNGNRDNRNGHDADRRNDRDDDHNRGNRNDDDDRNGGYGNGGYGNGGYGSGNGNYGNYNRALSDYDFSQVLQKIRGSWLGKMNQARDAVNSNYFTTSQVRQILQVFNSESDRLELAKLSFNRVIDQQNFRQLYDLFSYQAQSDLDSYTRNGSRY
jgi:hypothetical protein